MMYIIFNLDKSFRIASGSLNGLEKMIEDEDLIVKVIEQKDFKPEKYIYSLTESGDISSEEYILEAPPEL